MPELGLIPIINSKLQFPVVFILDLHPINILFNFIGIILALKTLTLKNAFHADMSHHNQSPINQSDIFTKVVCFLLKRSPYRFKGWKWNSSIIRWIQSLELMHKDLTILTKFQGRRISGMHWPVSLLYRICARLWKRRMHTEQEIMCLPSGLHGMQACTHTHTRAQAHTHTMFGERDMNTYSAPFFTQEN